jgi:hypothetical protein
MPHPAPLILEDLARNMFAYPPDGGKMKVNKDSTTLWKPFLDDSLPFLLVGSGKYVAVEC